MSLIDKLVLDGLGQSLKLQGKLTWLQDFNVLSYKSESLTRNSADRVRLEFVQEGASYSYVTGINGVYMTPVVDVVLVLEGKIGVVECILRNIFPELKGIY
jgi:hypothetical protein